MAGEDDEAAQPRPENATMVHDPVGNVLVQIIGRPLLPIPWVMSRCELVERVEPDGDDRGSEIGLLKGSYAARRRS
jgi:hypothetical protein